MRIVIAGAMAMSLGSIAFGADEKVSGGGESLLALPETPRPVEPRKVEAPAPKNDLHPRPLGLPKDGKSAAKNAPATTANTARPAIASQSAVGAMWDNPAVRTSGSLLLVLLLIVALAAIAKRLVAKGGGLAGALGAGGKAPEGLLEVLGRYPLTRGQTLILLKVDCRVLLLSQTTPRIRGGVGTLTTLCEITQPEEVASILVKAGEHDAASASGKFTSLLRAFDRTHAASEVDHVDVDPRRIAGSPSPEPVEAWDEAEAAEEIEDAPPVLHKFPASRVLKPQFSAPEEPVRQHVEPMVAVGSGGADSFGAIRQRLHALRGEAHR
jgi:flagellar biogenesis protein FliO